MKKFLAIAAIAIHIPIIFYFWQIDSWQLLTSGQTNLTLIALARIFGLLAVYFVLSQLIFIGRVKWLEKQFGLDKLSIWHHFNGFFALLFILAHPFLLIIAYGGLNNLGFFSQIMDFIRHYPDVWQAVIAVLIFVTIVTLSVSFIRKHLKYEKWYFLHLLTYVAILMAFGHQLKLGGDFHNNLFVFYWYALYFLAFGQLIWYRFLTPLYNFYRHHFFLDHVVEENAGALSCYIKGRNLSEFKVVPGQFMIVRFLNKQLWWQQHPFSISGYQAGEYIRLTIKPLGDFTSTLKDNVKVGDKILLDGPHGVFILKRAVKNKLLFIAGGVGITPIRSILEEALLAGREATLLYGNRNEQEIIFKDELDELKKQHQFGLHYILSEKISSVFEHGNIDKEKISRLVPDLKEREVYLCGPVPMMKAIRRQLTELGLPKKLIHFEKFSLG
ncbi:MAG: ferredoxin reductase family protein [Candidatus Komeilibacteria bacterium]|nr:ferredoxin reductase family protein [Candidatus Komeilibacteria bacterium]